MDLEKIIRSLAANGRIFAAMLAEVSDEDAAWKPESGNWSILEIVCHLVDEEVSDFRTRVRMTLDDPSQPWPHIDPEGWAIERAYQEQNFRKKVSEFTDERSDSIVWLRSLQDPNWENTYRHPQIGPLRAGDIMASWAAHDLLHQRQLSKRLFELNERNVGIYNVDYAGSW